MRLVSNSFDACVNAGFITNSHTERKLDCQLYNQLNLLYCLNQGSYYKMVANLYALQNTEGDKVLRHYPA